jgi:hypothetical protein
MGLKLLSFVSIKGSQFRQSKIKTLVNERHLFYATGQRNHAFAFTVKAKSKVVPVHN